MKMHVVSGGIKGVVTETFYILQGQRGMDLRDTLVYCMTPEIYDSTSNNLLIGFGEPTIITTNKHTCTTHEAYPEIKEGTNAIVMGDLIEDYLIVKNLKMNNVIGIGFFNKDKGYEPEVLNSYMDTYDIVIANDGNLNHVVELVKSIIGIPMNPEYSKLGASAVRFAEVLKQILLNFLLKHT
eukprot:TRINITY_DN136950_c0_g1_i1.p2 TRINITY_DN136950_c0_g1~~TRINITY_DN136950_c0_g1_i1.p2  ORF type:complete len:182 (-),score=21.37 TRINITY_DN136950_c0_g1_i1:48-593(-)